ncbi:MAG: OmpA family protein [Desulfarculaceae bacterium]|nr:OmpA family protein [Desulfarculaceae bacterium]
MKRRISIYQVIGLFFAGLACTVLSGFEPALAEQRQVGNMIISDYKPLSDAQQAKKLEKRINTLDKRILYFQDELDWLELKIKHFRDANRTVPHDLSRSIQFKKEKIAILSRMKQTLAEKRADIQPVSSQSVKKEREIQEKATPEAKPEPDARKDSGEKNKKQDKAKTPEIEKKTALKTASRKPRPAEEDPESKADDCDLDKAALVRHIKKENLEDWVRVVEDGPCLKLDTTLPILFSTGSARIAEEYKPFFERFASFLDTYDVRVLVNGYTDPDPINTEKYPTNFELGAARAANVVHEMVGYGLKPSIFHIGSTAEHRFEAKGRSQRKSMERKAEVTVIFTS